jgi:hypothetical protein
LKPPRGLQDPDPLRDAGRSVRIMPNILSQDGRSGY